MERIQMVRFGSTSGKTYRVLTARKRAKDRLAVLKRREVVIDSIEATEELARHNYRQVRRRHWTQRVTALREFFPLMLSVLLAPSWARGAERARWEAAIENQSKAEYVVDAARIYREDEDEALRRVSMLRRELELARMEVRHARERRENMEKLHAQVIRAKLVQSLVDEETRPMWMMIDERKGAVA